MLLLPRRQTQPGERLLHVLQELPPLSIDGHNVFGYRKRVDFHNIVSNSDFLQEHGGFMSFLSLEQHSMVLHTR